jgi:uncharacterized protein YsxB (DUF464 family)
VLEVTFYRDQRDRFAGISAHGHVDFAEHGQDIVCAAVSGILQDGEFDVMLDDSGRDVESVQAIVVTAELAVTQVARRFPEHVSVARERV